MDDRDINLYLSRILSGFYIFIFNKKKYKLKYPGINIKYEAELLAQEEYNSIKFNSWPTKETIVDYLVDLGLWSYNGDNELKKIEKNIDDAKVNLYLNFLNPIKTKTIRKTLDSYKKNHDRLFTRRHAFDHITVEGYCDAIKNQYILLNSIFDENDLPIKELETNIILFNSLCNVISSNIIDIHIFRKIARSDIWRNYWSANKENLFGTSTINWTDEQKTLVVLTKMYDNVHENPECPTDDVIEDDDMFDGFMIYQRRENEKTRAKNRIEKSLPGKLNNANEVFLVAKSKKEAEAIYGMNDSRGSGIINERKQSLNKNNIVKEQNLPDIQRDLLLQSNEQRKQKR